MAISNASPIQFWPIDQDTFNEKEVCGIELFCYCQPWEITDIIVIPAPTEATNPDDYSPALFDESDNIVWNPQGFGSQWARQLDISSIGISEGQYYLKVYSISQSLTIGNPNNSSIWSLVSSLNGSSTLGSNFFQLSGSGPAFRRWQRVAVIPNRPIYEIHVTVTITNNGGGSPINIAAVFLPESGGVLGDVLNPTTDYTFSSFGTFTKVLQLQPSASFVGPQQNLQAVINLGSSTNVTVRMTINPSEVLYTPDSAYKYKSDCIDIRDEHECTDLITYSNNKDFAGLKYDNLSPSPEFKIRVPMVFFHEQFPGEEEVHALSDDTWLRLSSQLEKKRNMELGYIPYYMHEKLQLILMQDNVYIDGLYWTKKDPYNIVDANKRYGLRMANVLLTDKNYIQRNLI